MATKVQASIQDVIRWNKIVEVLYAAEVLLGEKDWTDEALALDETGLPTDHPHQYCQALSLRGALMVVTDGMGWEMQCHVRDRRRWVDDLLESCIAELKGISFLNREESLDRLRQIAANLYRRAYPGAPKGPFRPLDYTESGTLVEPGV